MGIKNMIAYLSQMLDEKHDIEYSNDLMSARQTLSALGMRRAFTVTDDAIRAKFADLVALTGFDANYWESNPRAWTYYQTQRGGSKGGEIDWLTAWLNGDDDVDDNNDDDYGSPSIQMSKKVKIKTVIQKVKQGFHNKGWSKDISIGWKK